MRALRPGSCYLGAHELLTLNGIALLNKSIRLMGLITDQDSANTTLLALAQVAVSAKSVKTRWGKLTKLSKTERRDLRKKHTPALKSSLKSAFKTLAILTIRWKSKEIRAAFRTLVRITKAINTIRKSLKTLSK